MTALSADFARAKSPDAVASSLNIPVAAATTIYQGAMVGVSIAGSGYAANVAATPDYRVLGVARANVTNTSAAGFGSSFERRPRPPRWWPRPSGSTRIFFGCGRCCSRSGRTAPGRPPLP